MILLTLSVSVVKNKKLFFIALYALSVGDGGHKPCVQTFAADQFPENTMEERDAKSSFFNWWYLAIVIGSIFAVFIIGYLMVILMLILLCKLLFELNLYTLLEHKKVLHVCCHILIN